jgi:small subunit ribosomal protein S14
MNGDESFIKAFVKIPIFLVRDKHRYKLSKLPRNSSFARVRNQCFSTGRPRGVDEFFRIYRIVFRGLASRGPLMGIKKSSW